MKRVFIFACVVGILSGCQDPLQTERIASLGGDPGPYENGPYHRAGFPCTWCHASGGVATPHFDLAGTVYARPGGRDGLAGVQIHLFDATGGSTTLWSNEVGNFFLNEGELTLKFPLWVTLEYQSQFTAMKTPIFREKSCATCHYDPASQHKVGHLYMWEK